MARGLTERDRFLRRIESLALSALPVRELTAASEADKHHDGVMVALVPEDPESIAVDAEGALTADDLHITMCDLGKTQDLSAADKTKILADTRRVCDEIGHTFSTTADGVIVMGQNDEGVPATALLVQSDDIVELYDALADALNYRSRYPSFIPHMTTGYGVPVDVAQERVGQTIDFNNVIVKFGDDVHTVPLASSIVAAPRGANVIDRVIDSLGRLWDEALHPRDGEGRFIKKNGAVSGQLAVPKPDRSGVKMVDANRASVVGFHSFDNEVWVLAEITNPDGSKVQGFARAGAVKSVAPVKARLDALYPVSDDDFVNSALERTRQLDLLLAKITNEYGPDNDATGAMAFLETLGLSEKDLDYIFRGEETDYLGGMSRVEHTLSADEKEELDDIIADAKNVKDMRSRVHGLREDPDIGFSAEDAHEQPAQRLLTDEVVDPTVVAALDAGVSPFDIEAENLIGALRESSRFERHIPTSATGVSYIEWYTDTSDKTGHPVGLAGTGGSTTDRAYFVKQSLMGAEMDNSDIVREVLSSLIAEQIADATNNDGRALPIPRSVFGQNPEWDGEGDVQNKGFDYVHQPAFVISQHAGYFVPTDWYVTDAVSEEVVFRNDIADLDEDTQADQRAAFDEDMGNLYGNSVAKMILWDFAVMNTDRNAANALLASSADGSEGVALPIDHGFAFEDDVETVGLDTESTFEWFMQYQLTKAWLAYVLGGLELNDQVSEATLRQVIVDFSDVYGKIDAAYIFNRFKSIPGVTEKQIDEVGTWLGKVVDRINWIRDNGDSVLQRLTGQGSQP